jgi:hypothetical protein
MLTYLSNYEVTVKLRRPLYDKKFIVILNNKMLFNRFYGSLGFPLPKLYGYLNKEAGFLPDGAPLTTQAELAAWFSRTKAKELFIKPAEGLQGFNVMVIKSIEKGSFLACEGSSCTKWSAEDLYRHLFKDCTSKQLFFPGYIIEQLIKQHPSIDQINASSVNTCRILTVKDPDGRVDISFAFMRFGRAGKIIDNRSQGGLAAGIDVETGVVQKASYNPKWGVQWSSVHPDSGAPIEGFEVPYWAEVKELAARAAAVTPGIKTIGWDIAVTEDGPVLIEGNSSWTILAIQQASGGLMTPKYKELFNRYGLRFR